MDERVLLGFVHLANAGGGRRSGCAPRVQYLATLEQLLQAVADLVPRALVLRLLLTPDNLPRVRVPIEDRLVLIAGERIELLDAYERHIANAVLAARLEQIEVDLAAAEHEAAH